MAVPYLFRPPIPAAQIPAQPVFGQMGTPMMTGPKPSLLTQPAPAFERNVPQQLDPTNMLWAGTLMDIGAFIANPFGYQMRGLGPQMMVESMQYNNQLETQRQNDLLVNEQLTAARNQNAQVQNPYAQMPADIQEYELSGGDAKWGSYEEFLKANAVGAGISERPIGMQVDARTGNLLVIGATGAVTDTGVPVKGYSSEIKDVGGAIVAQNTGPGGQGGYTVLDPNAMNPINQQIAGSVQNKAQAETDAEFDVIVTNELPGIYQSIDTMDKLIAEMEAGKYSDTGPIQGFISKFYNPETAIIELQNIDATLNNLQRTNLAPVTEKELALVQTLYADIGRGAAVNIARMKEARNMLNRKVELMNSKIDYFNERGTLAGYGRKLPRRPSSPPAGPPKVVSVEPM